MKLSALLVTALLGLTGSAHADDGSFCVAGFVKGPSYGKGGPDSSAQDACAGNPGKKKFWHFHGFVEKSGKCHACWDEESSTCESKAPSQGYRYLGGNDCGSVPPADPADGKLLFDPKAPPPPPPPKLPKKK